MLDITSDIMIAYMILQSIAKAIKKSGKTRYEIAKETGVSEAQLCRVMQGRKLTCETAELLLKYFGYELRKKKKAGGKK
jgi:transcriptional regulator with XRE-family HTH domain